MEAKLEDGLKKDFAATATSEIVIWVAGYHSLGTGEGGGVVLSPIGGATRS